MDGSLATGKLDSNRGAHILAYKVHPEALVPHIFLY